MALQFSYTEEEIEDLVRRIYPRAIAYLRNMLGKRYTLYEAEDILHDVLCTFVERKANILSLNASAYIFKMLRNTTINMLTRNRLDLNSTPIDGQVSSALDRLAQAEYREDAGESHLLDSTPIEDIVNFSNSFSSRMQDIFYLSRIKGYTHREIAEQLGISVRAVEKYLQQSVALYREHFGYGRGKNLN